MSSKQEKHRIQEDIRHKKLELDQMKLQFQQMKVNIWMEALSHFLEVLMSSYCYPNRQSFNNFIWTVDRVFHQFDTFQVVAVWISMSLIYDCSTVF